MSTQHQPQLARPVQGRSPIAVSTLMLIALLATPAVCLAQFNKCIDADGKLTFTDMPCPPPKQAEPPTTRALPDEGKAAAPDSQERRNTKEPATPATRKGRTNKK